MTALLIFLSIVLIGIIVVQVGKVSELAGRIRGEEDQQEDANRIHSSLALVFVVFFLAGCIASAVMYKNSILWYGPHQSASEHGSSLDYIFNVTLVVTGIVFFVTQILLFWFTYRFRAQKGRPSLYLPHDNRLEIIWTALPAVVMTFLVVGGLDAWNEVMADVGEDEPHMEIEATGMQFAWMLRYPGDDGLLGEKNYKLITANNPLGQNWEDVKNHDDIVSTAPGDILKLPVNEMVRVRITARDVLHNFDLPHFRVKMDAIPGLPTYFKFRPTITTEEYRRNLGATDNDGNPLYPEYWEPADPSEPDGPKRWEAFHFELACAELCGNGHYSMRRMIEIVERDEYDEWVAQQKPYYGSIIQGTDEDPFRMSEEQEERKAFMDAVEGALQTSGEEPKALALNNVNFATGSADLTNDSERELGYLIEVLSTYPELMIEVAGHTDNVGETASNLNLSSERAAAVVTYLVDKGVDAGRLRSVGYGDTDPLADNNTADGREQNRRTEFKILAQ